MRERFLRALCAASIALGCCLAASSRARAEFDNHWLEFDPQLRVRIFSGYPRVVHGAYGPTTIGVEVHNKGAERSMRIEISGGLRTQRNVRVPARDQLKTFFYLPSDSSYMALDVTVIDTSSGERRDATAMAELSGRETVARLGPISTAFNVGEPLSLVGSLDNYMPDDWLGLSGIRLIIVEHEFAARGELDWKVLLDWVAMGGVLVIATPKEAASEARPWPKAPAFAGEERLTASGSLQRVGFGAIARVTPDRIADLGSDYLSQLSLCSECRWNVADEFANNPQGAARERLGATVRGPDALMFGTLSLFVLLTGPLGWLYFIRRRDRPLRYVAFALCSALLFSGGVLAQDLAVNGWTPKAAVSSVIFIDQRAGVELGFEDAALHAPTLSGTELRGPLGVQLIPSWSRRPDTELRFEATQQILARGIGVRERGMVAARWLMPQRGRLEVEASGGALFVENQLGVDLQRLVVWHDGAAYQLPELGRGRRAQVTRSAQGEPNIRSPGLHQSGFVKSAVPLFDALMGDAFGKEVFVAEYSWSPALSRMLGPAVRPIASERPTHLIAGVYR